MMAYSMNAASARAVGARLLGEVEEGSLEELLDSLRKTLTTSPSLNIPIPDLSAIITRHQRTTQSSRTPLISLSGRYLPFLYHFISTLIAVPHNYAVVVVDAEGKFDVTRLVSSSTPTTGPPRPSRPSRPSTSAQKPPENETEKPTHLPATLSDLAHIHIHRPPDRSREAVETVLSGVDEYMVYGDHASRDRVWWGTVVVGGIGGDVNAGWKGWLRVDRESVGGFAVGISVEEALRERNKRWEAVERAGWVAGSVWGGYVWKGG
ncbi:hypothetical protein F5Y03DRAFT_54816 [Xylaria venustula]|nr:hypothetical protein F5Y03DRAFT_54816 [Xylaria venustula]